MISLRDNGILDRAEVAVTGDYTDQALSAMYNAVTGAVVVGGIAAIEAVAGRVASMLSVARIEGGPRARQALTPTVLSMIGRNLIEAGESLHLVKVRYADGTVYLCPGTAELDGRGRHRPRSVGHPRDGRWGDDGHGDGAAPRGVVPHHQGRRPGLPVARRVSVAAGDR